MQTTISQAGWLKQTRAIMGTEVMVELWHADESQASDCSERIFSEMQRINELMSSYRADSELSAINRDGAIRPVKVSAELYDLIEQSVTISRLSAGVFDITYASIGYRYDYRQRLQPSDVEITAALPRIDFRKLILQDQTVKFAEPGMRIDLGGIAKGHAVDRSIDIARQCGIRHAVISAGGDSRILGDKQGRPRLFGIQHPRRSDQLVLKLPVANEAISTSGDYERFFIADDTRVHHIINPATGKSANLSWSATVIGPDATTTDALSTTVFILGPQQGLQLIESLPGIDAIIIDSNAKIHYSSGLQEPAE
ncbi:MAG: FAD:protein FMN transferase [Gammaproteobacteria bacterium]|nr:FAD:protein FMN transferase [Gammaproteobacteria bacterium]